ncbi:MAG: hypothetical protein HYY95_26625, partial [Candidatus Rokubacteria bacterium]|nr:hypothetical protein [Candidatus Rokubacteria bacterium]
MIPAGPSVVTFEVIRLIRRALAETHELTQAITVLADRVDRLTAELALGELAELTKLAARALSHFETTNIGHNG